MEPLIVEQMSAGDQQEQRRLADVSIEKAEQLVARRPDSADAHYTPADYLDSLENEALLDAWKHHKASG